MQNNIVIRGYQKGDEEAIVKLLEHVFNGWFNMDIDCSHVEYWRWKFIKQGFKQSIIALAELDGQVVGVSHNYPVKIKIGDKIFNGNQATDARARQRYGLLFLGVTMRARFHSQRPAPT